MSTERKYKYYHEGDFRRILKLICDNRLETALAEFEQYLYKYPNDICAYAYYADTLMKLGRFEMAAEILNDAPITYKTPEISKQDIILAKLKLCSYLGKYEQCLEILRDNFEMLEQRGWNLTELLIFFKKQLGLLLCNDYSASGYKVEQITNYSEEAAIDCITKSHFNLHNKDIIYCFNDDFPLEEVYYRIRNMLPLEEKLYENIIDNAYIFRYDNNGKIHGESVDYIKVYTILGTSDIVTMYPFKNRGRLPYKNLTLEVEEYPKVKRMSQIEKFNQRYGKIVDKK